MSSLHDNTRIFERKLTAALRTVPAHLLSLPSRQTPTDFPPEIISPIFPLFTSAPIPLADHLRALGYAARPVPYPIVPRGHERVRVVIHARNTEAEFDELIAHILDWVAQYQAKEARAAAVASTAAMAKSTAAASIAHNGLSVDLSVRVLA